MTATEVNIMADNKPNERRDLALCLSGGGYRAMLFHAGSLWRLNEAGLLGRMDRISSISGGSIAAGLLGLKWNELDIGPGKSSVATNFETCYIAPLRAMAQRTIDIPTGLKSMLLVRPAGNILADAYRKHLFGNATLQDLPEHPRFVINATNLQSGVLWRFSRPYCWDYRVGKICEPDVPLAMAVAASSAFPPFLSPVVLRFREDQYEPKTGQDLQRTPYTTRVALTDGGVYDNLGLETVIKSFKTVLVSDGGGKSGSPPRIGRNWLSAALRVNSLIDNQVRSLRKRQLMDAFASGKCKGAYWGIRTGIGDYELSDALPCPLERTQQLAATATRLCRFDEMLQERLINWGYACCDASLRSHVDFAISPPTGFPYPISSV